jgi:hypothetical protein
VGKFNLKRFARELNDAARSHPIGSLQEIRAKLHRKRRASRSIFSEQTIFERYAFHHGGRSELQFNIGDDGSHGRDLRSGVAFDFSTSRSLPSIEPLVRRVPLFNRFIRANPGFYSDMKMWYWRGDVPEKLPVGPVPPDLVAEGVFVFLGNRRAVNKVSIETVLDDMDRLLPLYEYIESEVRRKCWFPEPEPEAAADAEIFLQCLSQRLHCAPPMGQG